MYGSISRSLTVPLALALLLVAVSADPSRSQTSAQPPETEVWITLGADAFSTLRTERALDHEMPRVAEAFDIVLSRVRRSELPRISAELHAAHRRCAGFITHDTEAEGRAVLANAEARSLAEAPISYTIDQPEIVQAFNDELSADSILTTITALSTQFNNRFFAHPSGVAAAEWIRDLWAGYAAGRTDVTVELYAHAGIPQRSVVLTIPGASLPNESVVLGAHLDSIRSGSTGNPDFVAPGADDDASGIAVLSEVIRVAMLGDYRPARTVQFMGYAAEEIGLEGSEDIVADYLASGVDVVAVLQLDMTAFNGSTADVGLIQDYTNSTLTGFVGDLLDTYQPLHSWTGTACGYGCSDHASWHNAGYPAAFAFESRFGQHNPAIHTPGDTTSAFGNSGEHALKFARLATAFLVEVGKSFELEIFADGFESGSTTAWSETVP